MASLQTKSCPAARQAQTALHPTNSRSTLSRRLFLRSSGATCLGWASLAWLQPASAWLRAAEAPASESASVRRIADPEIRAGVEAAVFKNLIPAATERVYPGHFTINADGGGYGNDSTWPGLDSWQMIGPYLHLGRTRLVLDYFDFVRASQRKDGNIPFAIFNGNTRPGGCLRGLKYPDDLFTYTPPKRDGLPASSQETRQWIGLFEHWQTKGFPLSTLGPVCYVLSAAEIFDATGSRSWLKERLGSVDATGRFLLTLRKESGLIGGSGFYIEAPPREGCDGVTQCYVVHAFRQLARLSSAAGDKKKDRPGPGTPTSSPGLSCRPSGARITSASMSIPSMAWWTHMACRTSNWAAVAFRPGRRAETQTALAAPDGRAGFLGRRYADASCHETVHLRKLGGPPIAGLPRRPAQRRGRDGAGVVLGSPGLPAHEGPRPARGLGAQSVSRRQGGRLLARALPSQA